MQIFAIFLVSILCFVSKIWAAEEPPLINQALIQRLSQASDPTVEKRLKAWHRLIRESDSLSTQEKLTRVNDFFNQFRYQSDMSLIGKADYWMTPSEFIVASKGDCEDFSIAKYFTLIAMNVSMNKLRITYVKAIRLNQAHMVLAYYPTKLAVPLILDNLIAAIKPASERDDLLPVYSFNGDGLWLAKQRGQTKKVGGSQQLSLWRQLIARMNQLRET